MNWRYWLIPDHDRKLLEAVHRTPTGAVLIAMEKGMPRVEEALLLRPPAAVELRDIRVSWVEMPAGIHVKATTRPASSAT